MEWAKVAWWLPIQWSEYVTLTLAERRAIGYAVTELQKERETITGQSRQDRRNGLG